MPDVRAGFALRTGGDDSVDHFDILHRDRPERRLIDGPEASGAKVAVERTAA